MHTGHAYFPNPHYRCGKCDKDLWSKRKRLKRPNHAPAIFIALDNTVLCERCFCKLTKEARQ